MGLANLRRLAPPSTASSNGVWLGIANEQGYPHHGVIDFADNRVNPGTGTIRVRGVFANPKPATGERVLTPGLFARVRVPVSQPRKALLVAERAIASDQGQKYLLVVNGKNEAEYRPVRLGRLEGGLRVVDAGVQAGERVIVNGLQRVRPGRAVEPKQADMESFAGPPAKAKPVEAKAAEAKPAEGGTP